jgi:putative transposase
MPKMARVVIPYYPHHVVQCGHNLQMVFVATEDLRAT